MESAHRGIKSAKRLSRTAGIVAALTVGASLLAVPSASAEDTPSSRQLLDACGWADLCEFHPQSYWTYTGPNHQVGSTAFNCASQTNQHRIDWSDTTGATNSLGVSIEAGVKFWGVYEASVETTYRHDWSVSHTDTESNTVNIPSGYKGWMERGTAKQQATGWYEIHSRAGTTATTSGTSTTTSRPRSTLTAPTRATSTSRTRRCHRASAPPTAEPLRGPVCGSVRPVGLAEPHASLSDDRSDVPVMPGIRPALRTLALAACSLVLLSGCAGASTREATVSAADRPGPTVIGSDRSTESRVVAALYGEILTAAGQQVRTAPTAYASAADTAKAVLAGEIGLAPAYETATLRALPGGDTLPGDMAATLSMALPPGIVALKPAAAERGVVLAVTRSTARRHSLRGLADLGRADGRLTLGGPASGDPDAPSASSLKKTYGVTLAPIGTSRTADVLVLRGTAPSIRKDGLVVLTDPKGVIPPEHVFPLISAPSADSTARKALAPSTPG